MFPSYKVLKKILLGIIMNKEEQGYQTEELYDELKTVPDSYDAIQAFAVRLSHLPYRDDWTYIEPSELTEIMKECATDRPTGLIADIDLKESVKRVKTAFYASVCGCVLGKPVEEFPLPTLYEMKDALKKTGEWPIRDYLSEDTLTALGRRNICWTETTRGKIRSVAGDDDITYTIMGMRLLEQHGIHFTKDHMRQLWIENLPIYTCWGPERNFLLKAGISSLVPDEPCDFNGWVNTWNQGEELCGALIRADAYGYACPGRPQLAAEFAWRDASTTHRKTGIYGAMFTAAAIAAAPVIKDRMEIFDLALKYVPQNSRFHEIAADSLAIVKKADNWEEAYAQIHNKYEEYGACRVYQEIGTLMNTLKFAENVNDGFCKQVSQGNDTDSFGATSGSILGEYFGEEGFDESWLEPFNDTIDTTMGGFFEHKLSAVADRMSKLPALVNSQLGKSDGIERFQ